MKIANISTIKNKLSQYLNYVKKGETVRILDRDIIVADLVPAQPNWSKEGSAHLASLESQGVIIRGTGKISPSILKGPSGKAEESGVLSALLEERRISR